MNEIELTKKLISIPSYVNKNNNEQEVLNFLFKYLNKNLQNCEVLKQVVTEKRYNIIVQKGDPKLLVVGHTDTVQPREGWDTNLLA